MRATRALVDLDAIAGNVAALRRVIPEQTRLLAVVKADAYGHGAPQVAATALAAGASALGVATVSEGQVLRRCGITAPILILSSIDPSDVAPAIAAGLEITVAEPSLLDVVEREAAASASARVAMHVKVDSGLRRYGALPEVALHLARRIDQHPHLTLAGLATHFASSDEPEEPFTAQQYAVYQRVVTELAGEGITAGCCHVSNSAALITGVGVELGMVRAGIALYGVPPSDDVPMPPGMRSAMRLESRVARVTPLLPGDTVGYNRTWRADTAMQAVLTPIGYADGYRRGLFGRVWAGLGGRQAPLLGRVSMDQTVFAVPDGVTAQPGDTIHLMGRPEDGAPTAADLAGLLDTNTYEVLVGWRARIPRVYLLDGEVVAVKRPEAAPWEEAP
ncbi:MAG: alanine racemase [Thermomicrobiales bacterium]|nr:alanine racemase [Thermomicrobiales bacterium]